MGDYSLIAFASSNFSSSIHQINSTAAISETAMLFDLFTCHSCIRERICFNHYSPRRMGGRLGLCGGARMTSRGAKIRLESIFRRYYKIYYACYRAQRCVTGMIICLFHASSGKNAFSGFCLCEES